MAVSIPWPVIAAPWLSKGRDRDCITPAGKLEPNSQWSHHHLHLCHMGFMHPMAAALSSLIYAFLEIYIYILYILPRNALQRLNLCGVFYEWKTISLHI